MPETRLLLERVMERVELRQFTLEGFHDRRDHKRRNQRIRAGVLGISVFALAAIGLVRLLGSEPIPADQPSSAFVGTWTSTELDLDESSPDDDNPPGGGRRPRDHAARRLLLPVLGSSDRPWRR